VVWSRRGQLQIYIGRRRRRRRRRGIKHLPLKLVAYPAAGAVKFVGTRGNNSSSNRMPPYTSGSSNTSEWETRTLLRNISVIRPCYGGYSRPAAEGARHDMIDWELHHQNSEDQDMSGGAKQLGRARGGVGEGGLLMMVVTGGRSTTWN
jgi:hypothetical protein